MKKALVAGVVLLIGTALFTGSRGRVNAPSGPPTEAGPGGATLRYWQDLGRLLRSVNGTAEQIGVKLALHRPDELSEAAGRDFWRDVAALYEQSVEDCRSAVAGIQNLRTDGVDPSAVDFATRAINYLKLRGDLMRAVAADCKDYAEFFADLLLAGGRADADTPINKRFREREEEIQARMLGRAPDSQKEKMELKAVLTAADEVKTTLTTRYHLSFPDLNQRK